MIQKLQLKNLPIKVANLAPIFNFLLPPGDLAYLTLGHLTSQEFEIKSSCKTPRFFTTTTYT